MQGVRLEQPYTNHTSSARGRAAKCSEHRQNVGSVRSNVSNRILGNEIKQVIGNLNLFWLLWYIFTYIYIYIYSHINQYEMHFQLVKLKKMLYLAVNFNWFSLVPVTFKLLSCIERFLSSPKSVLNRKQILLYYVAGDCWCFNNKIIIIIMENWKNHCATYWVVTCNIWLRYRLELLR